MEKNKFNESWEIVNKKITFDSSYRFKPAWWIMFWIFVGICAIFLALGIVVFVGDLKWSNKTNYGFGIGVGASLILVFALFWIVNNFINSKMNQRPDFMEDVKKIVKKQNIWMNVFRISTALLTLVCGLLFLTSGFMWDNGKGEIAVDSANTMKIIAGCTCLLYMALASVSITGYYMVIILKQRALDMLVVKDPVKIEVKA